MTKRKRGGPASLALMLTELAFASWETIGRRSLLMARGECSPAEYSRMIAEKMQAAQRSAAMLARPGEVPDWHDLLAPWHLRARRNARRLRRKG